jgi:DNA-binding transcriptional LysR family regulator
MEASLATVQAGLGYAWLPEHLISEPIRQGSLRALPLAIGSSRAVPLNLVLVRPETAGPAARAAVEIFQRHRPYGSGLANELTSASPAS